MRSLGNSTQIPLMDLRPVKRRAFCPFLAKLNVGMDTMAVDDKEIAELCFDYCPYAYTRCWYDRQQSKLSPLPPPKLSHSKTVQCRKCKTLDTLDFRGIMLDGYAAGYVIVMGHRWFQYWGEIYHYPCNSPAMLIS